MQFVFEDYVLDLDRRELSRGSKAIATGPQVFDRDFAVRTGDAGSLGETNRRQRRKRAGLPELERRDRRTAVTGFGRGKIGQRKHQKV